MVGYLAQFQVFEGHLADRQVEPRARICALRQYLLTCLVTMDGVDRHHRAY